MKLTQADIYDIREWFENDLLQMLKKCEKPKNEHFLILYITPADFKLISGLTLIDFYKKNMAGCKRPKNIIFCELPKTSTGKIQKFEPKLSDLFNIQALAGGDKPRLYRRTLT